MNGDRHPPLVGVLFPILRVVAFFVFLFFAAPLRILQKRNVRRSGPLLVISNHLSNTDPVVVQYSCPRLIHFLARKELFSMGGLGKFVRLWGAVPIKQSSADKGAIKRSIELLKAGECVGIFPEGQLSPDGRLLELFDGTALIVRLSGAPCVCVGLQGTNRVMPHPRVVPTWAFSRITATWGEVKEFSRESTTEEIMGWIESELKRLSHQETDGHHP